MKKISVGDTIRLRTDVAYGSIEITGNEDMRKYLGGTFKVTKVDEYQDKKSLGYNLDYLDEGQASTYVEKSYGTVGSWVWSHELVELVTPLFYEVTMTAIEIQVMEIDSKFEGMSGSTVRSNAFYIASVEEVRYRLESELGCDYALFTDYSMSERNLVEYLADIYMNLCDITFDDETWETVVDTFKVGRGYYWATEENSYLTMVDSLSEDHKGILGYLGLPTDVHEIMDFGMDKYGVDTRATYDNIKAIKELKCFSWHLDSTIVEYWFDIVDDLLVDFVGIQVYNDEVLGLQLESK